MSNPGWSKCVACGLEGYDIGPRGGHKRSDGSNAVSRFCRWCSKRADVREKYRIEARRVTSREAMRRRRVADGLAHRTIVSQRVILGPCPCRDCGRSLVWTGLEWQTILGYAHRCGVRRARYAEKKAAA